MKILTVALVVLLMLAGSAYWLVEVRPGKAIEEYLDARIFVKGWQVESVIKFKGEWIARLLFDKQGRSFLSASKTREFYEAQLLGVCPHQLSTPSPFYNKYSIEGFTIEARGPDGENPTRVVCDKTVDSSKAILTAADLAIEQLENVRARMRSN